MVSCEELVFVLDILKEIVQNGEIDSWPTEGEELLLLVRAAGYLRRKALWSAIHVLEEIVTWHSAAAGFLARYIPEDTLLNAAAELYHNSFVSNNRLLLLLGSVLGPAALAIPQYYTEGAELCKNLLKEGGNNRCIAPACKEVFSDEFNCYSMSDNK